MIKSIVGFGDSWIYGNEIGSATPGDPTRLSKCILGQIGELLNLPTLNFGRPGSSLTSMLWEFNRWVQHTPNASEHLVIVGLTYDVRESWWPSNQAKKLSTIPGPYYVELNKYTTSDTNDEWTDFVKTYIVNSNHDDVKAMRYWQAVNFLDSYCYKHNIPLLQINVFFPTRPTQADTLYSSTENLVQMLSKEMRITGKNLIAPCTHANEDGARFLADKLVAEIYNRGLIK